LGKYENELLDTYKMVDETLGWVRQKAGDATLIVMSDHGFAAFDRAVHLNTWLMKEGFLTLDDPKNTGDEELFAHVDWSRTQAYSVGLNGLYLNLRGRERDGSVAPGAEAEEILRKISEKLITFATGYRQAGGGEFGSLRKEYHGRWWNRLGCHRGLYARISFFVDGAGSSADEGHREQYGRMARRPLHRCAFRSRSPDRESQEPHGETASV
jgi:hypothetical protein